MGHPSAYNWSRTSRSVRRRYEASGRNGYTGVDVYDADGRCLAGPVFTGTRKAAETVESALNEAYSRGMVDAFELDRSNGFTNAETEHAAMIAENDREVLAHCREIIARAVAECADEPDADGFNLAGAQILDYLAVEWETADGPADQMMQRALARVNARELAEHLADES